jgi:ribosomal-protein-alanine N-acetyltransferase
MAAPGIPVIETARLVLTIPGPEDAPRLLDYVSRNRVFLSRWEPPRPPEYFTLPWWKARLDESRKEHEAGRSLRLVLFPKDDRARPAIGVANFSEIMRGAFHACLLGYALDERCEGRGLMHEALAAGIDHAWDVLRLHRIMANHLPENHRSARLLRRLGFVPEGYARDYLFIDGAWRDHVLNALTNPRWKAPP